MRKLSLGVWALGLILAIGMAASVESMASMIPLAAEYNLGPALSDTEQGDLQSGWQMDVQGWWYQREDGTYPKEEWLLVNGYWYYFDRIGYMVKGWNKIDGEQYCFTNTGELVRGWAYDKVREKWYYYNEDGNVQKDWLYDLGSWYWFTPRGEMADSGYRTIGNAKYYFFDNGQMAANQYVGTSFLDESGQHDKRYDIVLEGKKKDITGEEKDYITDALKNVPRGWVKYFLDHGWKIMYYTDKSYFSAPDTSEGVYYVYHKLDTSYRKLKFTDPESLTKAFGEYIGYASGCYEEDSTVAADLIQQQPFLMDYLDIPDYFDGDTPFYFGSLCKAFLEWDSKNGILEASPIAYEIMNQIVHSKDL